MTRLARSVLAGLALSALVAGGYTTSGWARAGAYLADLVKTEPYRGAWTKMLAKERDVPSWVKDFIVTGVGDSTPAHMVPVGYRAYLLATLCKFHDCANGMLYVMFAPDGAQAYAKLVEAGKTRWLGKPDAAMQTALSGALTQ
ncbi:MAG: Ivy family c-type lysozyme inhibitor [Hyphomicrobiales bacterium]